MEVGGVIIKEVSLLCVVVFSTCKDAQMIVMTIAKISVEFFHARCIALSRRHQGHHERKVRILSRIIPLNYHY